MQGPGDELSPCPEQDEENSSLAEEVHVVRGWQSTVHAQSRVKRSPAWQKRPMRSEGVGEESSIRKVLPPERGEARPVGEKTYVLWVMVKIIQVHLPQERHSSLQLIKLHPIILYSSKSHTICFAAIYYLVKKVRLVKCTCSGHEVRNMSLFCMPLMHTLLP